MHETLKRIRMSEGKWKSASKYFGQLKSKIETFSDLQVAQRIIKQDHISANKYLDKSNRDYCHVVLNIVAKKLNAIKSMLIEQGLLNQQLFLNRNVNGISKYRYDARFTITPSNLETIKGYNLLLENGWYHPRNNPTGVVKDHRVSIKFGYDNNISPLIIGNIKNCEFLKCSDNLIKKDSCSISIQELILAINDH